MVRSHLRFDHLDHPGMYSHVGPTLHDEAAATVADMILER
jgi:hypothetical protein